MTAHEMAQLTRAELQAACDSSPEVRDRFERQYGGQPVTLYGMYHTMFLKDCLRHGIPVPPHVLAEYEQLNLT